MAARKRLIVYAIFACALILGLLMAGSQLAASYPGAGTGYEGWTAETTISRNNVRHVQIAYGGGYLYLVEDDGQSVRFYRAADEDVMNWEYMGILDINPDRTAMDAYIDASGNYVAVSWKEHNGSRWGLAVALSGDNGSSWIKWVDSPTTHDNYEAHVDISGNRVHAAYVSNYTGRNEVWYARFDLSLNLQQLSCVSDRNDSTPASLPCLEFSSAGSGSVYYQHGGTNPHPIYQAYNDNWGDESSWVRQERIPVGPEPHTDFSYSEVTEFWTGGTRRVMLVAEGHVNVSDNQNIYYMRWDGSSWGRSKYLQGCDPNQHIYPQIAWRGTGDDIMVAYRQTGGTMGYEGMGYINCQNGEDGAWYPVEDLFFNNLPDDSPGCIDVCGDGTRFYTAQVGSGSLDDLILIKREDNADPAVSISDPGAAHNGNFTVSATASDDFNKSNSWMLGPAPFNQGYESGIVYAEFRYRRGTGDWKAFPGGLTDNAAPWSKTFDISGLPDGTYDFWVRVYDTATRLSDAYFHDVVVDRVAPSATPDVTGGAVGDGGWYTAAPTVSCTFSDDRSGVAVRQYKIDGGSWTAYGSGFTAMEGDHTYYFRCRDSAGNWSTVQSVNVKLDIRPPTSSADIPPADGDNGWRITPAAATVTLSGSDPSGGSGLKEILYAWNGTPNTSYDGPIVAPEGTNTLNYVAVDNAGNQQTLQTLEVKADYNDPTVNILISEVNGDNGWYKEQPTIGPTIEGDDGGGSGIAQTYYRFDSTGDWNVYSTPFALLEGNHTINYYSKDIAGRTSAEGAFVYKADFTDPSGEITSPEGGDFIRNSFEVTAIAEDALSGVAKVDFYYAGDYFASDNTSPYMKSCDVSGYADGEREIRARIFDNAGRSSWTALVNTKKDTSPPKVEITEPTGEEWIRGMVTVKAAITDKDPGEIGKVNFYLDGELFDSRTSAPWMGSLDTTCWSNDYHIISVRAWDKAGNASSEGGKAQVEAFVGNNISETNHFAEGCTRAGFDTWLCLQNPGDEPAQVTVNYMVGPGQGMVGARNYAVPPKSRMTVYVNQDVGPEKDVSMQVTSSKPIVSERPMYFDYSGLGAHGWKGGHTAQGVSMVGREWYLAEGCTRAGFEEWICIQNPGDKPANVRIDYMLGNGQVITRHHAVEPWQRYTVSVNQEIGPDHDVSAKITSDQDIVVERPMYFNYQGAWDGGHNVMAVPDAACEWYFAEGCTRAGFNQWICIMNPGEEPAKADITYMTETGLEITKEVVIPPHTRHTINANVDVAREHDVSTRVVSDKPIIVERPMYFWYGNLGGFDEGSCAVGSNKPCSTWYLAEGCTRAGFEEWICLQNPNDEVATVRLTYMLENGSTPEQTVNVAPHSRLTVRVNDFVGPDHDVSTQVQSDMPIIVERPMYALYRGVWPSADSLNAYTFER